MILSSNKLKVGYFALGNPNSVPAKIVNEIWDLGYSELTDLGVNIIKYPQLLKSTEEVNKAIDFVDDNKIDVIIINQCGWVPADTTLKFVRDTDPCQKILWTFGYHTETLPITGLLESTSTLSKFKNIFFHILGSLKKSENDKKLNSILQAILTIKHLKKSKFGLIGYNCPGMVDATPDELAFRRCTGAELVHLDLYEVFSEFKNVKDEDCYQITDQLKNIIKNIEVPDIDLISSVKLYVVIKKIVEKYGLSGLTIRCWPELKGNNEGIHATPC